MITYKSGDLFADDAQCFVNAVNCVGTMGKGIALEFKRRYPEYYKSYQLACKNEFLHHAGDLCIYLNANDNIHPPEWIISAATKTHWKDRSNPMVIDVLLKNIERIVRASSMVSLAMPALGCGLGGLVWRNIQPLIEARLSDSDCDIRVYLPQ